MITQTEMVSNLRYICNGTTIPVIADAGFGYGNPINVVRTIQEFPGAGLAVAGLHMEDQVFPRSAASSRARTSSLRRITSKLRAALDSRQDELRDHRRTDALAVNGWDDTVSRCKILRRRR
ncbi:MAG: isocitrate lyase/phosphoenolpyruvate mutase family protein [Dehalococcoidia bacterium]